MFRVGLRSVVGLECLGPDYSIPSSLDTAVTSSPKSRTLTARYQPQSSHSTRNYSVLCQQIKGIAFCFTLAVVELLLYMHSLTQLWISVMLDQLASQ